MKAYQILKGSLLTVALGCVSIAHAAGVAPMTAKPLPAKTPTATTPLLQGAKPTAAPAAALTAQQVMDLFKKAFPKKPMLGGACSAEYGVMDLNAVNQLVKGGKSDLVMNHLNKNVLPCLANPQVAAKNKNLTAAIKQSCSIQAVPLITVNGANGAQINLSAKLCQPAMAVQDNLGQKKADEALFPSMMANVGCQAAKAVPFDALKLADFVKRNQAIMVMPQSTAIQKQEATKNIQKAMGYVKELTVCSKSQKDLNFNKAMTAKFASFATCQAPVGFPNANPQFTAMLFGGPESLCSLSKGTANAIATNQAAAAQKAADLKAVQGAMQGLGVPMMLGKVNPAGYVGFRETIVTPLASPNAPQLIAIWLAKDPAGLDAHFKKVLANVTAQNGKTTNPKATAAVVNACAGSLSQVTNPPIISQICQAANATKAQNSVNAEVATAKKALAVPMVAMQYKTCAEGFGQKLSATMPDGVTPALQKWLELDQKGANGHMNGILSCLNDKAPHPKLTSAVKLACDSGVSAIPGTETLCATATQKEEANTNALLGSVGAGDVMATQESLDATVTEDPTAGFEADPSVVQGADADPDMPVVADTAENLGFDLTQLPADGTEVPGDGSADDMSSIGDGSEVDFQDPTKVPGMDGMDVSADGTELTA
jgi:hypothetical protein